MSIKILGIAGSLRENSYNKMLLLEAQRLAPKECRIEIFDIASLPLYNQDLEKNLPEQVVDLKRKIVEADAILFSTPEYNYSMPGVIKNAIDWGSRPHGNNSWSEKPAAIMGATPSGFGTLRAQLHLRQSMLYTKMHPLNNELYVSDAPSKFNEKGELVDVRIRNKIRDLLEDLVIWTIKLRK